MVEIISQTSVVVRMHMRQEVNVLSISVLVLLSEIVNVNVSVVDKNH